MIGVISYQTGNSRSVIRSLRAIGADARLVADPTDSHNIHAYVLPGVGSADVTMASLRRAGWVEFLADRVVGQGVPFLGVCVGMQILLERSAEGDVDCLGWIPGEVLPFEAEALRVPQMGWNSINILQDDFPLLAGIEDDAYVYYVNSFWASGVQPAHLVATSDYGVRIGAVIGRDNIVATQFHIEKSGPVGLRMLDNFVTWAGK